MHRYTCTFTVTVLPIGSRHTPQRWGGHFSSVANKLQYWVTHRNESWYNL